MSDNTRTVTLPPFTIIDDCGSPIAGESYTLQCSITGKNISTTYEWFGPPDENAMTNETVLEFSNSSIALLRFTSLQASHDGLYTCKATAMGGVDVVAEENVTVTVNGMLLQEIYNDFADSL